MLAQLTGVAARAITAATSWGCDIIATCELRIVTVFEPARSAMSLQLSGGVVRTQQVRLREMRDASVVLDPDDGARDLEVASRGRTVMPFVTALDGAEIFFEDWGNGPPIVLSHGWPLSSASWESQMLHLASHGFRVIAPDRRGHGQSTKSWIGNEMNTYADDLATLIDQLDLRDVMLIGFSAGGGEVARYIGRHGSRRVAGVALVAAVTPFMLRTDDNPAGVPIDVFDDVRAASLADRAELYRRLADGPFFGNNRAGATVSQGTRDAFWAQGMQSGHRNAYECIRAFSETDFRADLARFDMPTLVIHGNDDQVVPYEVGGQASAALVAEARLVTYEGAPHGIIATHRDRLCGDLLAFARR